MTKVVEVLKEEEEEAGKNAERKKDIFEGTLRVCGSPRELVLDPAPIILGESSGLFSGKEVAYERRTASQEQHRTTETTLSPSF